MKHRIEMITESPIGDDSVRITIETDSPVASANGLKALAMQLSELIEENYHGLKHIRNFPVPDDSTPRVEPPPPTVDPFLGG